MKKKFLANLMVGNVLLHNLHWNVEGKSFKQVHEYLEELYDEAFEQYDEVAELMKMNGKMPPASLKEYVELMDLEELEVRSYSIEEAMKEAKKYLVHMKELALKIRSEEDDEEFVWANLMEDYVTSYNKHIWFIDQSLA